MNHFNLAHYHPPPAVSIYSWNVSRHIHDTVQDLVARANTMTSTSMSDSELLKVPPSKHNQPLHQPGVYDFSFCSHLYLLNDFLKEMNMLNHAVQHAPTGIAPPFLGGLGWPHQPPLPNEPATEALQRPVNR